MTSQMYLESEYNKIVSMKVRIKYTLPFDSKKIFDQIVEKIYQNQMEPSASIALLSDALKVDTVTAKKIAADLIGMRVLPAIDTLEASTVQKVKDFFSTLQVDEKQYTDTITMFKKAVADEANGTYDHDSYLYADEPQRIIKTTPSVDEDDESISFMDLSPDELLSAMKTFLESNLLSLFDPELHDLVDEVNKALILLLADSPAHQKEIENALGLNPALIGKQQVIFDGRGVTQNCAAWIKDFYKVVGTDHFDALAIARYLIESANAKRLNEQEKQTLRSFLVFYHNVKQFPEPFLKLPVEQWHIIPVAAQDEKISQEKKAANPPVVTRTVTPPPIKMVSPLDVTKTAAPTKKTNVSPVSQAPIQHQDSPELMNLKNMLLQYPAGSLERQAIEEEIKKLSN